MERCVNNPDHCVECLLVMIKYIGVYINLQHLIPFVPRLPTTTLGNLGPYEFKVEW